ncbi:MAG TPA: hypothetical protein VMJ93_13660 [Verrucomicrobiae bacterium]|nr:hypothetical protein [Verrucomicrobiae bacterium]
MNQPMEESLREEFDAAPNGQAPAADARGYSAADVEKISLRNGWLAGELDAAGNAELQAWLERAAMLLGGQVKNSVELEDMLRLVFVYEAGRTLEAGENQDVLMREGAREVIRELANRVLDGVAIDSDRFKEIVEELKGATPYRSRELFQPIRVALAGRAGGGELDRVILLLDAGAKLKFATPVKGARQRIIEFCAAFE